MSKLYKVTVSTDVWVVADNAWNAISDAKHSLVNQSELGYLDGESKEIVDEADITANIQDTLVVCGTVEDTTVINAFRKYNNKN
jgi:hypothetical protein